MLNEIFEKLGLYDLVAVLLSGICMVVMTLIVNPFIWKAPLVDIFLLDTIPVFLLCVQQSWTTLAGASSVTVIASEPCS